MNVVLSDKEYSGRKDYIWNGRPIFVYYPYSGTEWTKDMDARVGKLTYLIYL